MVKRGNISCFHAAHRKLMINSKCFCFLSRRNSKERPVNLVGPTSVVVTGVGGWGGGATCGRLVARPAYEVLRSFLSACCLRADRLESENTAVDSSQARGGRVQGQLSLSSS